MPTRSPLAPTKRSRANTRTRLLEAGSDMFSRIGFQAVSVEDVCAAAGFTRGAFYSNFSSKDELFLALWDAEASKTVAGVAALAEVVRAGSLGLDELLASFGSLTDRHRFQLDTEFLLHALRTPDVARMLERHRRRLHTELAALITALLAHDGRRLRPGISTEGLTRMVIAAHEGAQHQTLVEPRRAAGLEESLLRGILEGCTTRD